MSGRGPQKLPPSSGVPAIWRDKTNESPESALFHCVEPAVVSTDLADRGQSTPAAGSSPPTPAPDSAAPRLESRAGSRDASQPAPSVNSEMPVEAAIPMRDDLTQWRNATDELDLPAWIATPGGRTLKVRAIDVSSKVVRALSSDSAVPLSLSLTYRIRIGSRWFGGLSAPCRLVRKVASAPGVTLLDFDIVYLTRQQLTIIEGLAPGRAREWGRWTLAAALVFAIGAIVSVVARMATAGAPVVVRTASASLEDFGDTSVHSGSGEIVARRSAIMRSTQSEPQIARINVARGDRVRAGDTLVEFDADRGADGLGAPSAARGAQGRPSTADTRMVAPFDGIIVETSVRTGDRVLPLGTVCELVDERSLRARVPFSENDAAQLRLGMVGHIDVLGSAEPAEGYVDHMDPKVLVSGARRTVMVELTLPVDFGPLERVGATATAAVVIDPGHRGLGVPAEAIVSSPSGRGIFVVGAESRAELQEVSLGVTDGNRVEVARGLKPGTRVVVDPGSSGITAHARVKERSQN